MLSSRTKKNKHGCLHVVQKRLESAHAQSCQKHFICLVNNSGAQKHLAAKDAFTIQENLFITVLIFSTVKYVRGSMLDCHLGKYRWWCCWGGRGATRQIAFHGECGYGYFLELYTIVFLHLCLFINHMGRMTYVILSRLFHVDILVQLA